MKKILTLIVLLGLTFTIQAQHTYVEKAENAYNNMAYYEAIDLFKKAYVKEKTLRKRPE